mmetsp:Transcript_27326/g.63456  ORF Transcript_27326/g.63456 Transcript_27326/m.63456 type:complete len:110 (-) Transcript_27326:181-510(-)
MRVLGIIVLGVHAKFSGMENWCLPPQTRLAKSVTRLDIAEGPLQCVAMSPFMTFISQNFMEALAANLSKLTGGGDLEQEPHVLVMCGPCLAIGIRRSSLNPHKSLLCNY